MTSKTDISDIDPDFVLSVVVPVYNEAATLEQVVERVRGETGIISCRCRSAESAIVLQARQNERKQS